MILNRYKSTFLPGNALTSLTSTDERQADGIKRVLYGVFENGRIMLEGFSAKYDGKDYPYSGSRLVNTIALTRIDGNTVEYVQKKEGQQVIHGRIVHSGDGKTSIETVELKNYQGKPARMMLVYDIESCG